MKIFSRILLIVLGFMVVIIFGAHYLLTFKAKEILQEIVSRASEDKYLLRANKVSFFYRQAGIAAEKVELVPVTQAPRQDTFSFDKLEIRINSIINLLFRKNLEILKVELLKPEIVVFGKSKAGKQKHGIPESIHSIQTTLLQSIKELNVQDVHISDASLKIYSADTLSNSYLFVNHINLSLHDIFLDQQVADSGEGLLIKGSLVLQNPTIHLPDSIIQVSVNRLEADVSNKSLSVDTLDLQINQKNGKQQLTLSALDLDHLHWNRFLQEGVIELDTVMVHTGFASINLSTSNKKAENAAGEKKQYAGATFIIHHTYISDIAYQLNTNRISKTLQKENSIQMKVDGESLYLQEFSLAGGRQPAFEVEKLDVGFKDFAETDEQKKTKITLGALALNNHSVVLKNYLLETNRADRQKNYLRIAVPEFRLNNYDFEAVLQKKLAAKSIQLINPDITIDLSQPKKEKKNKRDIDAVLGGVMQKVSDKASLEEISIENGSITFLTAGKEEDSLRITGLSVVLDAGKFPGIKNTHQLMLAIKRFDSKGFSLKGKKLQLAVEDMKLLTNPQGVYFGKIQGQFGEGRMVDLEGVTILLNEDTDYIHSHDIHASLVQIARGIVQVEMPEGKKEKPADKGNPPTIRADKLQIDNVVFKVKKGDRIGVSAELDLDGDNLNFENGQLAWQKLGVSSFSSDAFFGKTAFNTGAITIQQPGIINIRHANGKTQTKNGQIDFSAEQLDLELGLESTHNPSLAIEGITLVKPALKIALGKNVSKGSIAKPGKAIAKAITLKKLELQEPTIDFVLKDSLGSPNLQHRAFTGTFLIKDIVTQNGPELKIGNVSYATLNPQSEFAKIKFNPASLQISISDIIFNTLNKHYKLHVDSVVVSKIDHTITGKISDTLAIAADMVGAGNFDFEKGQKIQIESLLTTANWWTENGRIRYHTPKQLIMANGLQARGGNTAAIAVDSFSILNRATREEVWNANAYEKGYETITGGKLLLSGVGITFLEKKPVVDIRKFNARNLHFTTEKDKTKLEDTIDYRPLLTGMFTKMALPLKIDSVLLNNARVDAHEISKKTGKRTHIFFTNITGYVKNVKTWDVQDKDTLEMRMRAQFYGTDPLRLHFKQSYDDTLQGFWMRVKMGRFNMPEMNQLLTPLMGLKISSGIMDSLLLVANGNEYFAYGTMDLRYHDLHAKIAKTQDTKGKLLIGIENFFVDLVLRNHDNGRTNILFKERLRKRGIFNFWAKIGLEGLLSNLGIKWDKKEQKRFEESLDKYNLPDKYWEDIDD